MQRNTFLRCCIGIGAFVMHPLKTTASGSRAKKGIFVRAGKDRYDRPFTRQPGDVIFNKVSSEDTDGDLYIFDTTRIKKGGPPLHFHYSQDEWWYIIAGEFLIRVGEETFHAKPGDSVFGPRGVPHTFAKIGEGEAKIILLFQPAGKMEAFFKAVDAGKLETMTATEKDDFRKAHGFEHIGLPIDVNPH